MRCDTVPRLSPIRKSEVEPISETSLIRDSYHVSVASGEFSFDLKLSFVYAHFGSVTGLHQCLKHVHNVFPTCHFFKVVFGLCKSSFFHLLYIHLVGFPVIIVFSRLLSCQRHPMNFLYF